MARIYSKGEVIEGEYKGQYIYDASEISNGKSVGFAICKDQVVKRDMWGKLTSTYNLVYSSNVKNMEILSEKDKGVDGASVGAAALMFGLPLAVAVSESGKEKVFYIGIEYKEGGKSLLKIDNALYDVAQRFMFIVKEKIANDIKAPSNLAESQQGNGSDSASLECSINESEYKLIEFEDYSVFIPLHFTQKIFENNAGGHNLAAFGPGDDLLLVLCQQKDPIYNRPDGGTFGATIIEENAATNVGSFHMGSWKDTSDSTHVWTEAFFKGLGSEKGVVVRAHYSSNNTDLYNKIKSGVLNSRKR